MYIRSFLQDKEMTITLSGEIDHHEARHAMKTITEKLDAYLPKSCILDFRDVTFMDSSGIGILLNRYKQMAGSGGTVTIYGVNAQVGRVLAIGGIGRLMKYFDTKEAAIAG